MCVCVCVCVVQVSAGIYWSVPDRKSSSQNQDGPRVHFHGPDSRYLSVTPDQAPEIEPSGIPVISDCVCVFQAKVVRIKCSRSLTTVNMENWHLN